MNNDSTWVYDDGGRSKYFKGGAGDCVCRSIAIATGRPYDQVYSRLAEGNATQRKSKRARNSAGKRSARNGIYTNRKWFKDYMKSMGFIWIPVMGIGTGCKMHLRKDELPPGTIIAKVSKHYVTVIDGVMRDTYDCSRNGTRCVYGYWKL